MLSESKDFVPFTVFGCGQLFLLALSVDCDLVHYRDVLAFKLAYLGMTQELLLIWHKWAFQLFCQKGVLDLMN
jgi:hypothetical protein